MKLTARTLLAFAILFTAWPSLAKLRWKEPQVVRAKLKRRDRRIIQFSGTTDSNATVRILKNKVKLYLDNGKSRWASIPQKDKVQFPLTADDRGEFSFRLYLPTTAVEIPVQVKTKKGWRNYTFSYRVEGQRIRDFPAMEASFQAADDEISQIDRNDNYYYRKNDKGLLIGDGKGQEGYKDSKVQAWGGIGLSYFSNSIDSSGLQPVSTSGSTLVIPTFRFGVDWEATDKILGKAAIRSTSGGTDDISGGGSPVTGTDFNWLEAQIGAVWFGDFIKMKKGRLGLDFGLQLQQLPFFRERPDFTNYAYFDNDTWNIYIGAYFQKKPEKGLGYEFSARYLYPVTSGDSFDFERAFPLMFEFGGGVKKRLTQGLSMGVFGQLEYFSTDVTYSNTSPARTYTTDLTLMLLTVDVRLIANF